MRVRIDALKGWILVAMVLVLPLPAAAQVVTGRLVSAADGGPAEGVRVRAEHRGVQREAGASDAAGRFRVDLAAVFGTQRIRAGEPIMLAFASPAFVPVVKLIRAGDAAEVRLPLAPQSGGTLTEAERARLGEFLRAGARGPLFLVPYDLPAGAGGLATDTARERLRANLERAIVTHVQSTGLIRTGGMALAVLPVESGQDVARLKAYGNEIGALAVISGFGALEEAGGERQVVMSSTYVVVPQLPSLDSPIVYVDDVLPPQQLASPRLWERLSKLWGRSTVLALGIREFREARGAGDRDRLRHVRAYLVAERASAGPGNEQFLVQLNALIALIDQELAR